MSLTGDTEPSERHGGVPRPSRAPPPRSRSGSNAANSTASCSVYGRMVADGEWRDYAIDFMKDRAVFSVFRRSSEVPIYRIEKNPKLARRQGAYSVISATGLIMRRGHELDRVLRVFDKEAQRLVAGHDRRQRLWPLPAPSRAAARARAASAPVQPAAVLEADIGQGADRRESRASGAVRSKRSAPNRRSPRSSDGSRALQPARSASVSSRRADAAALRARMDIDAVLDGVAIGDARPVGPGIGIARDLRRRHRRRDRESRRRPAIFCRVAISASSGGSISKEAVPCLTACA